MAQQAMLKQDETVKIQIPTMKPLDMPKKADKAEAAPAEVKKEEVIDFSKVEIEPLFKDFVDFETFSKSDFRAVKVKSCEAVKKSKKLLKFVLDDGTGTPPDPDKFVHDMAAAIDKIMADPELAKKMGQAGYERARDHFSWESIADKTVAVYQSVLDEQNK